MKFSGSNNGNNTADSYYSRKGRTAEVADVKTHFSLFIEQSDDLKYKK